MAERFGVDVHLTSPAAAREKWPLLRTDDVLGAAWLPDDGKVVPERLTLALAKGARDRGATVLENVHVLDIEHADGRATGVRTDRGTVLAEYVVLCGGMWSRQLALRCGFRPAEGGFDMKRTRPCSRVARADLRSSNFWL
jgi:4-methylaminobutanoate oxidase (formaldehyde-forming)